MSETMHWLERKSYWPFERRDTVISYYISYAPSIAWFAVVYDERGRNVTIDNKIRAVRWPDVECEAFNRCIAMCATGAKP